MSAWREAIAAAVNNAGLAQVVATALPPTSVTVGASWPQWINGTPDSYCGHRQTWYVYVVLPNAAMVDTVDATDVLVHAVSDALVAVGEVTIIEPVTIAVSDPGVGDPMPALRFTLLTSGATP